LPKPVPPAGNEPGNESAGEPNNEPTSEAGNNPTPPPVQLPAGRIGWREIANWPQLHAEASE
jgi:type IV pilus assembly protein PilX